MSTSAPSSHCIRHVARVAIEFVTPFHVGTGDGGYGADALVVTDANGLPAIPGSSIAGVLRAAFSAHSASPKSVNELFGYQDGDEGLGSRLNVTWGAIHNRKDLPVDGLLLRSCLEADEVLNQALTLGIRNHVRLSCRGAAEHRGKFDEQPVAAGHRFTFEIELVAAPTESNKPDPDWEGIMAALSSGTLRLGAKSRRGFGSFKVIRVVSRSFDLRNPQDFADYSNHPPSLSEPAASLQPRALGTPLRDASSVDITLHVQPRGFWMFGGGDDLPPQEADSADVAPVREAHVVWEANAGYVHSTDLLLPATAIKGAISHRVAFHANLLRREFADVPHPAGEPSNDATEHQKANALRKLTGSNNPAVRELFGFVAESRSDRDGQGAMRGRVLIDDFIWPTASPPQLLVPHVSIDRFTGGAADSKLFSERPVWRGEFPVIRLTIVDAENVCRSTRRALKAGLEDIALGRLALGAGAGRGLGYFEPVQRDGYLHCSAGEDWFDQGSSQNCEDSHD